VDLVEVSLSSSSAGSPMPPRTSGLRSSATSSNRPSRRTWG